MESPENNVKSVLTVLPIGQGACNLVEVYDNLNKLVFLGMVDCGNKTNEQAFSVDGNSGEFNSNVEASFDYITQKMMKRAENENAGSTQEIKYNLLLDLFILTHQDGDHWILLEKMLERVKGYVCYKNPNIEGAEKSLYCEENGNKILYKSKGRKTSYSVFPTNRIINVHKNIKEIVSRTTKFGLKINKNGFLTVKPPNSAYRKRSYRYLDDLLRLYGHNNQTIIQELYNKVSAFNYNEEDINNKLNNDNKILPAIGNFLKGGDSYGDQAWKFTNYLAKHLSNEINIIAGTNSYKKDIFKNNYVSIDLLCGTVNGLSNSNILNPEASDQDNSIDNARDYNEKNATSAVTLWTIGDTKYLFPGDATVHTMMHLNTEYTNLPKNEQEICTECVKRESAIMTAPHHGSDHSSMGKKIVADKAKYSEMPDRYKGDWGIYREFLDNYKPSAVTISAGRNYGFGHPGPEFVKATDCYFNNTGATEHIIYTCIDECNKNKYYGLYQTKSPIYSTLQYDGGDRKVYFQRLQFTNSIIPNYEIVNDSKIACQCNPNLSNYLTLDVGSCTGCSPKFIDESSSSSDWFCKYRCESTMAKDENTEDDKSDSSTETGGCFTDECIEEDDEVIMEEEEDLSEMPRPIKR